MKIKALVFSALMCVLLVMSGIQSQAATSSCPPHGNYIDRVTGSLTPTTTTHKVLTGYYVDGSPIYQICTVTTAHVVHGVYCGKCNTLMSTYVQDVVHHSISH